MDLQTLKARIRALVDDPNATYTTDDFLLPLINQKYEELYNRLRLGGTEFDERDVVLPSVPAGTPDLSTYAATGQPLELLVQPRMLEWKLAGNPDSFYLRAEFLGKVRDITPQPLIDSWEWRSQVIYITPATVVVDLRVTGDFLFSALVSDADILAAAKNIGHIVAYGTAALIGINRGNPDWIKNYTDKEEGTFDDLNQLLVRADLAKITRVARLSRSARFRRWPF